VNDLHFTNVYLIFLNDVDAYMLLYISEGEKNTKKEVELC